MTTYTKKDERNLEVTKPAPIVPDTVNTYNLDFLKKQELYILESINNLIAQRQKELEEVREYIVEVEALGIKTEAEITAEKIVVEEAKLEEIALE